MRQISNGYAAPPDACISFQTLYRALAAFEADLHQHIHLENNATLFLGVFGYARLTGHWYTNLPSDTYFELVPHANEFTHP
jgi:hypothetical protein